MYSEVECPYCGTDQYVDHEDGYGYEEDVLYNQECVKCRKYFTYTTMITYTHEAYEADCMNDGEHVWEPTVTYPIEATRMRCKTCDEERTPTFDEWRRINLEAYKRKLEIRKQMNDGG